MSNPFSDLTLLSAGDGDDIARENLWIKTLEGETEQCLRMFTDQLVTLRALEASALRKMRRAKKEGRDMQKHKNSAAVYHNFVQDVENVVTNLQERAVSRRLRREVELGAEKSKLAGSGSGGPNRMRRGQLR